MKKAFLILLFICALCSCDSTSKTAILSSREVMNELNKAYSLADRKLFYDADSIYRNLLSYEVSCIDTIRISTSYIYVLLNTNNIDEALIHINRAFPEQSDRRDRLRRYSYRLQAFERQNKCDSIWKEFGQIYDLVAIDSTLQLNMDDILFNKATYEKMCPR